MGTCHAHLTIQVQFLEPTVEVASPGSLDFYMNLHLHSDTYVLHTPPHTHTQGAGDLKQIIMWLVWDGEFSFFYLKTGLHIVASNSLSSEGWP